MVATRKNRGKKRQSGGQPVVPKSATVEAKSAAVEAKSAATVEVAKSPTTGVLKATPGVPPTYTCPPNSGVLITGSSGMCGKCDPNYSMMGNVCIPNPSFPVMVKIVPATPVCPAGSTLNGPLCEYPPPKSLPVVPMIMPAKGELAVMATKTITIPPFPPMQVPSGEPPKCANPNAALRGTMCFSCDKGVFDGMMSCMVCPANTTFSNGLCFA